VIVPCSFGNISFVSIDGIKDIVRRELFMRIDLGKDIGEVGDVFFVRILCFFVVNHC